MSTEISLPSQATAAQRASFIGQVTAVEQARAVAEVQAAVVVAQQVPRDKDRAVEEMRDSCGRLALADRAFYSVPNRGTGPSVHLARELARVFGNLQYGVHELRRDDAAGESEIQAFCWDVETNVRSTRTFISPHARMKKVNGKNTRETLTDIGDIYLSNQNVGARAVRECIFSVLPAWFTEEAQDLCRRTLENGEGVPLPERIKNMIGHFARIDVTLDQLEQKIGRKRGAWTASDAASMSIVYTSITRDGLSKDDEFPPRRVSADEITKGGQTTTPPPAATPVNQPAITDRTRKQMYALLTEQGITEDNDQRDFMITVIDRTIVSRSEVTEVEGLAIIADLQQRKRTAEAAEQGDGYDPTREPDWGGGQ